jgi:predicted TIM-barrel fold metal-dependent hydrolase
MLRIHKIQIKHLINYFIVFITFFLSACTKHYTLDDFDKVKKIDAHMHYNVASLSLIDQAKADNFRLLTINTDYPDFPPIEKQQSIAVSLYKSNPEVIAFASTFHMKGWDDPKWVENTVSHLDSTVELGAIAVKFWKNIGMDFRDSSGKLIMIDNPKFDTIFKHLREHYIPVIGHQGEPRECWLPFDKMVIRDLKEYFKEHPQYHMYLHPDMPSYEDQMNARDKMLEKNKNMIFMGCHLASLEWSVDELAKFFDKFPNAVADIAARMNQLQYQTKVDRDKVIRFFDKYQDRILYGTDITFDSSANFQAIKQEAHKVWLEDWKFLATDSVMTIKDFDGEFKGLMLPRKIIDKIYRLNAERIFTKAWKNKEY